MESFFHNFLYIYLTALVAISTFLAVHAYKG